MSTLRQNHITDLRWAMKPGIYIVWKSPNRRGISGPYKHQRSAHRRLAQLLNRGWFARSVVIP